MEERKSSPKAIIDFYTKYLGETVDISISKTPPDPRNIERICQESVEIFKSQGTVIKLTGAFTIIGDIHGNLQDLLNIFSIFGLPSKQNICSSEIMLTEDSILLKSVHCCFL